MKRLSTLLLISLLLLSILAPTILNPRAKIRAQGGKSIPITIVERSGIDLTNYTVKVELTSINFLDWNSILYDNGSDVYFTDSQGVPLYYWIEYFNKTEKKATIWIKLPSIPANGILTIHMHYGADNPYMDYRNGTKAFLLFDDFEEASLNTNVWSTHLGTDGAVSIENGVLKMSVGAGTADASTWTTVYSNHIFDYNVAVKAKVMFTIMLDVLIYMQSPTSGFYVFRLDSRSTDVDKIGRYDVGASQATILITNGRSTANVWYLLECTVCNGKLALIKNNIKELEATDTTFTSGYIGISTDGSSGTVYVDYILVRAYTDPEPYVVVNWTSGVKGSYHIPITIQERSGKTLANYTIKIMLNTANFQGWNNIAYWNGSDIYFLDEYTNPLYYWIEDFDINNKYATIWVRIPLIPANGEVVIRMHYGEDNPYTNYNDPDKTFLLYDDFNIPVLDTNKWIAYEDYNISNSIITLNPDHEVQMSSTLFSVKNFTSPIEIVAKITGHTDYVRFAIGLRGLYYDYDDGGSAFRGLYLNGNQVVAWGYDVPSGGLVGIISIKITENTFTLDDPSANTPVTWNYGLNDVNSTLLQIRLGTWGDSDISIDWIRVRSYTYPEPYVIVNWTSVKESYFVPITIQELSGNNLTDYAVKIVLNTTNFIGWDHIAYWNGRDIYFMDENFNPLYYWIEYFNKTVQKAIIWVKVPYIPANGNVTIYMYYGIEHSYTDYHNGSRVFLFFDDFEDGVINTNKWVIGAGGTSEEILGELHVYGTAIINNPIGIITKTFTINPATDNIAIHVLEYRRENGTQTSDWFAPVDIYYSSNYYIRLVARSETYPEWKLENSTGSLITSGSWVFNVRYNLMVIILNGTVKAYYNDILIGSLNYSVNLPHKIGFWKDDGLPASGRDLNEYCQAIFVRKFTDPEPTFSIGSEQATSLIMLFTKLGKHMVRSTYCEVLNVTTKEVIISGYYTSRIPLPTIGTFILRVYYNGILIKNITITIPTILYKLNITLPYINITDYRGLIREVTCSAPQTLKQVENLSNKFPYSRTRIFINGTGNFTLVYFLNQTPTNINIISNVSVVYSIKDSYLYINGTLHSTAEIIIEDQYLLSIFLKDRLGYKLANFPVYINGTKYTSDSSGYVRAYLVPEDYLLDYPEHLNFEFYRADSITTRPVHIRLSTDKSLTTEYLVPAFITGFKISNITTASLLDLLLKLLLQSSGNSSGNIVVSGYLKDYYDNPLAGRTVYVNVTDLDTGFTAVYTATTEGSGFFETSMIPVSEGKDYRITVVFQGDDTYTRAYYESYYSVPKAVAPAPVGIPYYYYLIAIAIVLILIIAVGFAIRTGKSISLKPRRYLKFRS